MDFPSDSASHNPHPARPPIWAFLFSMEKWRPYCNSHLANQTHETTTDFLASFPPSIVTGGENKPYSQFRKAADAIALVAAREQDAQNVSACAIEVNESGGFIIRVAQNRKVQRADLERVKRILDAAAGAVDAKGADEWKMMSKKDKTHATATLAKNLIFPMIVENCRAKISASLTLGRTSPSFSAWLDQADLSRVDEDHRDLILQWFTAIRSSNDLSAVLWSAYLMEPILPHSTPPVHRAHFWQTNPLHYRGHPHRGLLCSAS
ncbi:hypothetical protein B0H10DRAFT_653030 [Mycena sp. CBHHK59/15]|nr:hypothetical protein B0H10DRAFT_653030 [Mycena sp. CBHHK59/15]